jgi:hypothetical protein
MDRLAARIQSAFEKSRKLKSLQPDAGQSANIAFRLRQIFTDAELDDMPEKQFVRQVERVWPIAQYVDRK